MPGQLSYVRLVVSGALWCALCAITAVQLARADQALGYEDEPSAQVSYRAVSCETVACGDAPGAANLLLTRSVTAPVTPFVTAKSPSELAQLTPIPFDGQAADTAGQPVHPETERDRDSQEPSSPGSSGSEDDSSNGLGKIETSNDDFDGFEDVVFHPRLFLDDQASAESSGHAAIEHSRARVRLEDRRCEKPPRA